LLAEVLLAERDRKANHIVAAPIENWSARGIGIGLGGQTSHFD
jgi:hypothetical protein